MVTHKFGVDYSISFRRVTSNDKELLKSFSSNNGAIDRFIQNECFNSNRDVSFIFVDDENSRVMCFCSICCNGISVNQVSDEGELYITNIPAIEIDFFAVDESYRSCPMDKDSSRYETLSQAFLLFIMKYIEGISETGVGATYISLYSVPDAVNFYKRCGFVEFEPYMKGDEKPFINGCVPMFYQIH